MVARKCELFGRPRAVRCGVLVPACGRGAVVASSGRLLAPRVRPAGPSASRRSHPWRRSRYPVSSAGWSSIIRDPMAQATIRNRTARLQKPDTIGYDPGETRERTELWHVRSCRVASFLGRPLRRLGEHPATVQGFGGHPTRVQDWGTPCDGLRSLRSVIAALPQDTRNGGGSQRWRSTQSSIL